MSIFGIINSYNYTVTCLMSRIRDMGIACKEPFNLFLRSDSKGSNCWNLLLSLFLFLTVYPGNMCAFSLIVSASEERNMAVLHLSQPASFGLLVYLSIMTLLSWYSFVVYKWNHSRLSNIPGMSLLYMHIETESSLPNAY